MDIKEIKFEKKIRSNTPAARVLNSGHNLIAKEHLNHYKQKEQKIKQMGLKNPSFIENSINIQRFNQQQKLTQKQNSKDVQDFQINKITESNKDIDNFIEKSLLYTP